ncbi:sugar ABC transporter substrate-binding protein [Paludisphaera mucosa]|uniref:Substrate-binding domain-containing protein n=1 Tax=Paludisphaera mucosa TaxID=3030827 RepID=A0ABT6FKD2_9BACT|nr:substrate-binding domain-containing protein [Paludisphaera mucosa]MDG3008012.1 substrate-binding domain-containing protein [Paludisphaera mucosa]
MTRLGFAGTGLRRGVGLIAAALVTAVAGCESPVPPDVAARIRPAGAAPKKGLKSLELVPAPKAPYELEVARAAARIQAGLETVLVRTAETPADAPAGRQAELVREAIRRDPPAVIIEVPGQPDAELARAAGEARAKGILVVALGRPLGESAGGPGREIVVAPKPFGESAARIVQVAARNAVTGKTDPKAGAVILVHEPSDPLVGDRVAALKEALQAAGVGEVGEVRFSGEAKDVEPGLHEYLAAHPKATLVLATDAAGVAGAQTSIKPDRPYVVAGYSDDESACKALTNAGEYAAIGVYVADRLFRKGVNVAAHVLRGDTVADRVEIDTPILASPLQSGLPRGPVEPLGPGKGRLATPAE